MYDMYEERDGMAASRRGREHDAEGTRAAILYAAEEVFAQQGFDGAHRCYRGKIRL
jgi:hypothetical protein